MDQYKVLNVTFYSAQELESTLNELFIQGYDMRVVAGNYIVMESREN